MVRYGRAVAPLTATLKARRALWTSEAGVSLIDLMVVVSVVGILSAISLPAFDYWKQSMELGSNARDVERTLQEARLKAVTSNRPIRVRFNCPTAGSYRMVEVIGTSATPDPKDSELNRCQESVYPYPAPDREPLTRPNHDGPVRTVAAKVTFGSGTKNLEFLPNGSVLVQDGTTFVPFTTTEIRLLRELNLANSKVITVNSLGKVTLVP